MAPIATMSTAHASARVTGVASSKEKITPSGVSMVRVDSRCWLIRGPAQPRKTASASSSHTPNAIFRP